MNHRLDTAIKAMARTDLKSLMESIQALLDEQSARIRDLEVVTVHHVESSKATIKAQTEWNQLFFSALEKNRMVEVDGPNMDRELHTKEQDLLPEAPLDEDP